VCSVDEPQTLQPLHARCPTIGVSVDDQLCTALEGLVGHRIHVAHDDIGFEADLENRVSPSVNTHQDRSHLSDVGPERL